MAFDLHTNIEQLQWTTTLYVSGYAISMFAGGFLVEKCDAVKLQSMGLILFSIGSIVCALSHSVLMLSVGRFLQVLGGTSATVLCRIIIRRRIHPDFRIAPLANLTMVISLTPAVAPPSRGISVYFLPLASRFLDVSGARHFIFLTMFYIFGPCKSKQTCFAFLEFYNSCR